MVLEFKQVRYNGFIVDHKWVCKVNVSKEINLDHKWGCKVNVSKEINHQFIEKLFLFVTVVLPQVIKAS